MSNAMLRRWLHYTLCLIVLMTPVYALPVPAAAVVVQDGASIEPLLKKPYLELLQLATTVRFTRLQFDQVRKRLKDEQKKKENELKGQQKTLESQIKDAQEQLKKIGDNRQLTEDQIVAERHNLHCRIQDWQSQLADSKIALTNGVPVEYDNLNAKLDLLEKWPAAKAEINRQIETGQAAR